MVEFVRHTFLEGTISLEKKERYLPLTKLENKWDL